MADLGFLSHLPELCDVTFMVGVEKVNNKINNLKESFIFPMKSRSGFFTYYYGVLSVLILRKKRAFLV